MDQLTKAEETLLLAIWRLKDTAYGVAIRNKVMETTERLYTYGNLYSTLDQLTSKGYIQKTKGEPTPERGGRSKTYYSLTEEGTSALKKAFAVQKSLWNGISELSFDKE